MLRKIIAALPLVGIAGLAVAAPDVLVTTNAKTNNDRFFVAINWTFGAGPSIGPEAAVGFRSTRVKPGSVKGHGVEFSFPLSKGFQFGAVKLKAINGSRHLQGELGVGYSFLMGAPLITGGGFGSHTMFGTDYIFGNGFRPYLGIHTLGGYRKPNGGTACSDGSEPINIEGDLLCGPQ